MSGGSLSLGLRKVEKLGEDNFRKNIKSAAKIHHQESHSTRYNALISSGERYIRHLTVMVSLVTKKEQYGKDYTMVFNLSNGLKETNRTFYPISSVQNCCFRDLKRTFL